MQFNHNKRIFLGYIWILNDPHFFFPQNLQSKNYWWKSTLSLSKVLICDEIDTFTKEIHLKFEDDIIFRLFVDNIKNQCLACLDCIPAPTNCLKGKQHEDSTTLKESHNNHLKLKARPFLRILFSRKIAAYYKILSEAATKIFRKILSKVTIWRSSIVPNGTDQSMYLN